MNININTKDNNARFYWGDSTPIEQLFPAEFTFVDTVTKCMITVCLDEETFVNLVERMDKKINLPKVLQSKTIEPR